MYPLDAVGEGLRNLRAGTGRPVVTTIALLACAAVLLGLELGSLKALLESARAFRAAGGAVTILETRGQVDGAACHALGGISGIDAAAVTITGLQVRSAQLPQQPLPLVRATSGLADLLGITPNGVGVWISTDTAEQLGVDVGSPLVLDGQATRVAAIFDYPDDGRRPVLGYAIVEPAIAMGPFDECWGSSWPMNPGIQPLLLSSAYLPAVEQGQVRFSQLNGTLGVGFDGSEQFLRRPTSWSWLAAAVAGFGVGLGGWRLRRLELASARHAGVSRSALWLTAMVETGAVLAIATSCCAAITMWRLQSLPAPDVMACLPFAGRIVVALAFGCVTGTTFGVVTVRERHLFDYFKRR